MKWLAEKSVLCRGWFGGDDNDMASLVDCAARSAVDNLCEASANTPSRLCACCYALPPFRAPGDPHPVDLVLGMFVRIVQ